MAIPARNASPGAALADARTFFVTSKAHGGRALLQSEKMATLFIDVLRSYVTSGRFRIHDFVVMPDHFHLLITLDASLSIERAVQLIKGNFSFRAKRELGVTHEIWQRGFSDGVHWAESGRTGTGQVGGRVSLQLLLSPQAETGPQGLKPKVTCDLRHA
jgi:putative transposase